MVKTKIRQTDRQTDGQTIWRRRFYVSRAAPGDVKAPFYLLSNGGPIIFHQNGWQFGSVSFFYINNKVFLKIISFYFWIGTCTHYYNLPSLLLTANG